MNYKLPRIIIAGAQKSGTTHLLDIFRESEECYAPEKELHFFNSDDYRKGLDYYSGYFTEAKAHQICIEKTPDYLYHNLEVSIAERIYTLLPEVKILIILRHPIERAISAVKHQMRMGRIKPTKDLSKLFRSDYLLKKYNILRYSEYEELVEDYLRIFNKSQIKIVFFEDLKNNPKEIVDEISKWSGIKLEYNTHRYRKNEFKKSFWYLWIFYFTRSVRIANIFNRSKRGMEFNIDEKTMKKLKDYFASTIEYCINNLNAPNSWRL